MKRCPRCNLNFPDSLTLCESCGGGLGEAVSLRCPACGETAQPGWKFCVKCQTPLPSSGRTDLSNLPVRSELPPTIPLVSPETSPTAPLRDEDTTSSSREIINDILVRVRCRSCRSLVDEDSVFCEFCGASMFEDTAPLIPPPTSQATQRSSNQQTFGPDTMYESARADETTEVRRKPFASAISPASPEITTERTPPSLSMLQSYGGNDSPRGFKWWHGLLVVIFVLMVFGALGAGGWYWWSNRSSTDEVKGTPTPGPGPTAMPTRQVQTMANPADDELTKLRASRVSSSPSDANKIVAALEDAEKKYPTDYRFPYERAKLSIKGMISHHEAFEAIFLAGARAIDNGKASEMLNDLLNDKDGDFYKMSRGHREWTTLEEALRNKDKSSLETHDK